MGGGAELKIGSRLLSALLFFGFLPTTFAAVNKPRAIAANFPLPDMRSITANKVVIAALNILATRGEKGEYYETAFSRNEVKATGFVHAVFADSVKDAGQVKTQAELAAEIQLELEQDKMLIQKLRRVGGRIWPAGEEELAQAADSLRFLIAKSFRLESLQLQKRVACGVYLWLGIVEAKRGKPASALDEFWNMFNCSYQEAKLLTKNIVANVAEGGIPKDIVDEEIVGIIQQAEEKYINQPSGTKAEQEAKALGEISINSEPQGSSVNIDDKFVGKTPLVTKISAGSHRVRLELQGYQAWEDILYVRAAPGRAALNSILTPSWLESYKNADKAFYAGKWEEVIKDINEAIKWKSDSSARAPSGSGQLTAYFPYLKLGIAYFNLGQMDAALQALSTEIQLGAITQSALDLAELQRFFKLATQAKQLGASEENIQIRLLTSENIGRASQFSAQGQLDQALVAVSKALALSQEDAEARGLLRGLQAKVVQVEHESRIAVLIKEGRSLSVAGEYQLASAKFAEAQSIKDIDGVNVLLEQARAKLLTQVEANQENSNRRQVIEDILKKSKKMSTENKASEALVQLQPAIVLDPSNKEARELQRSLLAEISESGEVSFRKKRVEDLLAEGLRIFRLGIYEESLRNANHALALEPENSEALNLTARAYRALKERLLGKVYVDFPPRIIWIDSQDHELKNGQKAELVYVSGYKFSGVIYSDSPIKLDVNILRVGRKNLDNDLLLRYLASHAVDIGTRLQVKTSAERQNQDYITQYVVQPELKPGLSGFFVKATDPILGTVMHRTYMVYYVPPFYQTTWFYLALIGLMIASGMGAVGVSRHRHSELFKRKFNPYVAGAPVLQDDLFIGREQLLKSILQTIHNNSIMLFGERRIGKTSVQHHLKKRLEQLTDPDYAFFAVYVDLQGITQERFFITLREEIVHELAPLFERAHFSPTVLFGSEYDYRDLVEDIRQVLKALAAGTSKKIKLVLLIDEVDQLNSYDPRVNQRLRSLFMRNFSENLAAVVSGVSIKKHWDGEGSPWYNFFEEIEVKPFRYEDAKDLIERPIRGIFRLGKGVTDRIIEIAECRPYLIQKMCISIINKMHEEGRRMVVLADVDSVGRPKET